MYGGFSFGIPAVLSKNKSVAILVANVRVISKINLSVMHLHLYFAIG